MVNLTFNNFIFILLFLSLFSCSDRIVQEVVPSGSLKCSINGRFSVRDTKSTTKSASQTYVPDFISGVTLAIENLDYDVEDAVRGIYFNSVDTDITINENSLNVEVIDIVVGRNKVVAAGVCKNESLNMKYVDINKCNASDLNERATEYSEYLKELHPIYANYFNKGEIVKNISAGDNHVIIPMTSDSHRLSVILENSSDSQYLLKASIEDNSGNVILDSDDYLNIGSQLAFVVNDEQARGTKEYIFKVRCFTKGTNVEVGEFYREKKISIDSRLNSTKLYVFSKDELLEFSGGFSMSWEIMEEDNSGEIL